MSTCRDVGTLHSHRHPKRTKLGSVCILMLYWAYIGIILVLYWSYTIRFKKGRSGLNGTGPQVTQKEYKLARRVGEWF